jgi:hypothetical protein
LDYLKAIHLPENWRARIKDAMTIDPVQAERQEQRRVALEAQLQRAKKLYLLNELTEKEFSNLREELRSEIKAVEPKKQPDLEMAVQSLQSIHLLSTDPDPDWLKKLFVALLDTVYLEVRYPGQVVAIRPKPHVRKLIDICDLEPRIRSGIWGFDSHDNSAILLSISRTLTNVVDLSDAGDKKSKFPRGQNHVEKMVRNGPTPVAPA